MRGLLWKIPLLACIAALSWWLSLDQRATPAPTTADEAHKADYFVRHFETVAMNESGAPQRELTAEFMQHFPANDSTELTQPVVHIHAVDKPTWRIQSESGLVSADGELILLNGRVYIRRPAAPGLDAIEIHTRDLRVQMNDNYAETDEAVDIETGFHKMKGVGLQAHFSAPIHIRLLANVGGIHAIQ